MNEATYVQDWITRTRAGNELEAPQDERRELNEAIAVIASGGCRMYANADINYRMQKAAKRIMRLARRKNTEPLSELKEVCNADRSLDVYPESFLVCIKYTDKRKSTAPERRSEEKPEAPTLLYAHEQAGYVRAPAKPPKITENLTEDQRKEDLTDDQRKELDRI